MILVENLEDKKYLMQLFKEIYQELYAKKNIKNKSARYLSRLRPVKRER